MSFFELVLDSQKEDCKICSSLVTRIYAGYPTRTRPSAPQDTLSPSHHRYAQTVGGGSKQPGSDKVVTVDFEASDCFQDQLPAMQDMLRKGFKKLRRDLPHLDRMLIGEAGLKSMGAPPRLAFMSRTRV